MDQVSSSKNSYEIISFGCKVNTYDAGLIESKIKKSNLIIQERPVYILNTCAVTAEATKDAVKTAVRIKRKNPQSFVVITGCSAQVDTDQFIDLAEVDLVVGNSHKANLLEIIEDSLKKTNNLKLHKSDIFKKTDFEEGGGEESQHSRSFLKIQDGCNSFCTYCIIPFARGKSRSLSVKELVSRVNELQDQGYEEIVFTGVHIGDYFDESIQADLPKMLKSILQKTSIKRIRLSSLEPVELTPELLDLFEDNRMCPHFHMSIQSASNAVLKDMKRNYDQASVEKSLTDIHSRYPNAFVGMDVIVGFPTETDELFLETYECLKRLPWTKIHVFPYSVRPGTYAARLPSQVSIAAKSLRASLLRDLSQSRYLSMAQQQVGTIKNVLKLNSKSGKIIGLSEDYWNVEFINNQFSKTCKVIDVGPMKANKMENSLLVESV